MTFMLNDVTPFNVLSAVANTFIQMLVHGFNHDRLSFLVQGNGLLVHVEVLIFDLFPREEVDRGLFAINSKRFDEIEYQRLLVVVIGVEKADVRIKPREDAGLFDERVKNPVTIIQASVEGIFSGPSRTFLETVLLWEQA
jgi:hypothetical protein